MKKNLLHKHLPILLSLGTVLICPLSAHASDRMTTETRNAWQNWWMYVSTDNPHPTFTFKDGTLFAYDYNNKMSDNNRPTSIVASNAWIQYIDKTPGPSLPI